MELTDHGKTNIIRDCGLLNSLAAYRVALIPGMMLLATMISPLFGLKIPGQWLHVTAHSVVQMIAALALLACLPLVWRAAYRRADEAAGEVSNINATELNKQLREARYQQMRRSKELDAALKRLKDVESDITQTSGQARRNLAIASAVINSSDEAIFVTDVHGIIRGISAPAAQLCGVRRADAVQTAFDVIVPLSDPGAERPEHHPVRRIALRAVESANAAPHLENCLLTDKQGNTTAVLVSSLAITDAEGTSIGAWIRLEREGSEVNKQRLPSQLDRVTGLAVRDAFTRQLDDLQQESRTAGNQHQLLFLAPDNLDFIGDRHGYLAAEQMLWQIAETCRLHVGESGKCFSVSANRIGILLPDTASDHAESLADTIRQNLTQITLTWNQENIDLPVTVALTTIDANSPSVSTVIEWTEGLIRAGRRAGGNQVYRGQPHKVQNEERFDDRGWAEWLQQRLAGGLGHLLSQEILPRDKDNHKPAIECYMRVEDSDGVWVTPGSFLPALRRCGETAMMDLWVLDQVLQKAESDDDLTSKYDHIAINIAAESLQDPIFSLRVSERLSRSRAAAAHLRFEINENTAISLAHETSEFVQSVQKLGASVAIDNARGLGLVQLLQNCAPNSIKLEPALVKAAISDDLAAAQVRWLCESAHLKSLRVVACGIENEQWIKRLEEFGADDLQGSALNKLGPLMI